MTRNMSKTLSFLALHLIVGFTIAYLFTGSFALAGGIALVEPMANAVVFFFHERIWNERRQAPRWLLNVLQHRQAPKTA